jgi:hypothetical protein
LAVIRLALFISVNSYAFLMQSFNAYGNSRGAWEVAQPLPALSLPLPTQNAYNAHYYPNASHA